MSTRRPSTHERYPHAVRDLVIAQAQDRGTVTSGARAGLVAAVGVTLSGVWQRCRTHNAANLMSITPMSSWGWVKALLHSIYDQPDAERCTPSSTALEVDGQRLAEIGWRNPR